MYKQEGSVVELKRAHTYSIEDDTSTPYDDEEDEDLEGEEGEDGSDEEEEEGDDVDEEALLTRMENGEEYEVLDEIAQIFRNGNSDMALSMLEIIGRDVDDLPL